MVKIGLSIEKARLLYNCRSATQVGAEGMSIAKM
jgi:hypothetical protein